MFVTPEVSFYFLMPPTFLLHGCAIISCSKVAPTARANTAGHALCFRGRLSLEPRACSPKGVWGLILFKDIQANNVGKSTVRHPS